MEQQWIVAAVLVPALAWPACNGGTENLGDDGDGGSAGEQLEGDTTGTTGKVVAPASGGPVTVIGAGGAGSGGMGVGGSGGTGVGGSLPDSVGFGAGGTFNGETNTNTQTSVGAGGAYGYGAGGGPSTNTNTNTGNVGAGGVGAGGTNQTYAGADAVYDSSSRVIELINDTEQLYAGGSALAAIPLPDGPANFLYEGSSQLRLAVDDTYLYVCWSGGLYRMSKNGGGIQIFEGGAPEPLETAECRAVSVDDTMVHAAWFVTEPPKVLVPSWMKTERSAPQKDWLLEDVSDAQLPYRYLPHFFANDALYYANRYDEELFIGRIALDDYADETLVRVDTEFDSEYIVPLAVKGNTIYFQTCEQTDRWCSLFVQTGAGDEPIPYEQFQRDSVIKSLAVVDDAVVVALAEGIHVLETTEADLKPIWIHPSMTNYGPLLAIGRDLYFAADPVYSSGLMIWHLPLPE